MLNDCLTNLGRIPTHPERIEFDGAIEALRVAVGAGLRWGRRLIALCSRTGNAGLTRYLLAWRLLIELLPCYLTLDPHGTPLAGMLGQINLIEMERGDPMITAVVVLKVGSSAPGVGFWNLAEAAGLFSASASEEDQDRFWTAEFSECHRVWSARGPSQF